MKRINQQEHIQMLQAWLTTSLFAMVISHFTLLLLGQNEGSLFTKVLFYLGLVLAFILALHFWKITLGAAGVLLVFVVAQRLLHQSFAMPVVGADWWSTIWNGTKVAFRWAITLNAEKGPMPPLFLPLLQAACKR